ADDAMRGQLGERLAYDSPAHAEYGAEIFLREPHPGREPLLGKRAQHGESDVVGAALHPAPAGVVHRMLRGFVAGIPLMYTSVEHKNRRCQDAAEKSRCRMRAMCIRHARENAV